MSRAHQENLKEQLIASMTKRMGRKLAESIFQCDLWPVLDKAMTAGELMVARNTQPVIPVPVAIEKWLRDCVAIIGKVQPVENTVSRKEVFRLLYQLEHSAMRALADIDATKEKSAGDEQRSNPEGFNQAPTN